MNHLHLLLLPRSAGAHSHRSTRAAPRFTTGCDTNMKPVLFQSCLRDTGEVINDLSMPVFVDGRHWGAVRVGFENSRLP